MTTMRLSTVQKWCSREPVPRMRGFEFALHWASRSVEM